jgi:hypothetical protein
MLHLFMITGFVGWHFNSGMETGLLVAFSLLTFYGIISQRMAMISIGQAWRLSLAQRGSFWLRLRW